MLHFDTSISASKQFVVFLVSFTYSPEPYLDYQANFKLERSDHDRRR